jgi:hypothetical protein
MESCKLSSLCSKRMEIVVFFMGCFVVFRPVVSEV